MSPLNDTLRQRVQGRPHTRLNTTGLSFPDSSPLSDTDLEGLALLDDLNSTAGFDERAAREVETGLWVLIGLSALFLGLRLYCKRKNPTSKLRWEDAVLAASWVSAMSPLDFFFLVVVQVFKTVISQTANKKQKKKNEMLEKKTIQLTDLVP